VADAQRERAAALLDPPLAAREVASERPPRGSRARDKVGDLFAADLRSLAAFRIVLALVVLLDLASRARDLTADYTDAGVMPRADLVGHTNLFSHSTFSVNLISGSAAAQGLIFAIAALAGLGMLVGYRTRSMIVIVWFIELSIQWRNPLLNGGGEELLRVLLFWSLFLPLGAWWSVDRARQRTAPPLSFRVVSVPTAALLLQIAFMYWFAVILKSGPEWRFQGTALHYALSIDQLATPLGTWLLQFSTLLTVLTFGVLALEAVGPFLLFSPFKTGTARTIGVLLFMSLHLGIWLTLGLGIFPAIAGLCMVCFLPGAFWERTARLLRGSRPRSRAPRADGPPATIHTHRALNVLAGVLLLYVLYWNVTTVTTIQMPEPVKRLGPLLGISQVWDMFSPSPLRDDGWYVMPATLRGGRAVDVAGVLRGDEATRPVSFLRPRNIRGTYRTEHWRKYLENVRHQHPEQQVYLADYVCRQWNEHHSGSEVLTRFSIVYMLDLPRADNRQSPPTLQTTFAHSCA
jgi:hypothetical protein